MSFAHPEALPWLVVLLPLAAFGVWAAGRAATRRRRLLGELADALSPGFGVRRRLLRDGLGVAGTGLVLVALSGPLLGTWVREVQERGVDVMFVIDTSRSMLAEDLRPSRLERAKREVRGMLGHLEGDRVGLVSFAGDARRICPLTTDATTFRRFLDDVDTTTNALGGTAVGEGLEMALDSFDDSDPAASVIILLTDGEDHDSDPPADQIAYEARAREIPIHVVAFGTADGATIPLHDGRDGLVRDAQGEVVVSRPDEDLLAEIASISKGAFLSAERTPFPLDEIWSKRIAVMPGVTRSSSTREEGVDRFQWALVAALLCLGARGLVGEGRSA